MTTPAQIISRAFERIAPLRLAEKWDNVGPVHPLLSGRTHPWYIHRSILTPSHLWLIPLNLTEAPISRQNANRILLTIDLTSAVVEEAISTRTAAIISYHPPIFKPLSSFTLTNPLQKSLLLCTAHGISVFSPHTALDSVKGGINDWLSDIVQAAAPGSVEYVGAPKEDELGGEGRLVRFQQPVELGSLVNVIKRGLGLSAVQLGRSAHPRSDKVTSVAICAGSGGSMLLGADADVYFTGEMSHHEVLAAVASGRHVVLCGHTNTERGYLPTLAEKLRAELKDTNFGGESVEVHVSSKDRHPLDIL
ncbi:GTP cyclohydrolase 1 type 2/Nif3 [Thelephora terrestris]|uniref:GTP cyclohydrolase 1 type 2/Nif3 n=1 Tax=Thelephora terrestris TaxID=56493 RepID=A0A9P6HGH4_9AGAM|nr:GTP cyclohydrolase 1 type 2/Nif3 [Thelephora terrestris]